MSQKAKAKRRADFIYESLREKDMGSRQAAGTGQRRGGPGVNLKSKKHLILEKYHGWNIKGKVVCITREPNE
jgi:hypothetical protein